MKRDDWRGLAISYMPNYFHIVSLCKAALVVALSLRKASRLALVQEATLSPATSTGSRTQLQPLISSISEHIAFGREIKHMMIRLGRGLYDSHVKSLPPFRSPRLAINVLVNLKKEYSGVSLRGFLLSLVLADIAHRNSAP